MDIHSENNEVLIVFAITSPLHLLNAMSLIMRSQKKYCKVIIGVHEYWGKSIIPDRYATFCKKKGVILVKSQDIFTILKNESIYYYDAVFINMPSIKALLFNATKKMNIKNIYFIDEGISSYAGQIHNITAIFNEKGMRACFKYLTKKIISFPLMMQYAKHQIIYDNIFNKQTLTINLEVKNSLTSLLKKLNFGMHTNKQPHILFCSQPFVDLNIMTENEYRKMLENIQQIVTNKGYDFIIKKHPAEKAFNYEKHGMPILLFDGIVEEYVANNNVIAIISKNSTSSILCPSLYNINSYIIDQKEIESLTGYLPKLFKKYCQPLNTLTNQ